VSLQECLAAIAMSYPEPVRDVLVAPMLLKLSSQSFQNIWFLPYLCSCVPVLDQVVSSLVEVIIDLLSREGLVDDRTWTQIHMLTTILLHTLEEQHQKKAVERGSVVPVPVSTLARILQSCSHSLSTNTSTQLTLWVHLLAKVLASCARHGDNR